MKIYRPKTRLLKFVSNETKLSHDEMNYRIDCIEQRSYSDTLLCSGSDVVDLINNSEGDNIKSKFVNVIKNKITDISPDDISSINYLGKDKKTLKVTCTTEIIKKRIISKGKQSKVTNFYVSEFLTHYRHKLFFEARQIKRKYNFNDIFIYTRYGDIFYKIKDQTSFFKIARQSDLVKLERLAVVQ